MATGMDTDYLIVPIRRYLDAVEDMAVPSRRTQGTGRAYTRPPLSLFEQLPLEIRQEIYGWLGFPIGGKVWELITTKQGGMCVRTTLQCILFSRWDLFPEGFYDIKCATTHSPIQSRWDCVEQVNHTRASRTSLKLCSYSIGGPDFCSSLQEFDAKFGIRFSRAST